MKYLKRFAVGAAVLAFWIAIWYIAALAIGNPLIFPTPHETAMRLCTLVLLPEFRKITLLSFLRITIGILTAIPAAFIFATVCTKFKVAKRMFEPAVLLMKSTPVVSFILIAIFIFERELIPSAITFVMIFPVLYRNVCEGIVQAPGDLLEMARVFRISWILKLKSIYLPSVMPYFYSALATSVGLAIKAGIAAEVVAYIPDSIGKKLSDAKSYMEPADLLAWTAVIIILSLLLEKGVTLIISLLGRRKRYASDQ